MKLVHNEKKNTYSLKGLSDTDLQVIATLMANVRLGQSHPGAESCFRVGEFLEAAGWDYSDMELNTYNKNEYDYGMEFV